MFENQKIKIEASDKENSVISIDSVINNIKHEPEVEFVLILPPEIVKIEPEDKSEEKAVINKNETVNKQAQLPRVKCPICGKNIRKDSLKLHQRRHDGKKSFKCDFCSSQMFTKGELVDHMWTHQSKKRFKCSQCNREFNHRCNLKNHLLTHSESPRPFQCELCPKNYVRKESLQMHTMAKHLSETKFSCNLCDYVTKRKACLQQHQNIHSRSKQISCPDCPKQFISKSDLKKHQLVHKVIQ